MYLINISFHVHTPLFDEAVSLVRNEFLPAIEQSGILFEPLMSRILIQIDPDSRSFALQMKTESLDNAQKWLGDTGSKLLGRLSERYGERILFFTTPMEIMQ